MILKVPASSRGVDAGILGASGAAALGPQTRPRQVRPGASSGPITNVFARVPVRKVCTTSNLSLFVEMTLERAVPLEVSTTTGGIEVGAIHTLADRGRGEDLARFHVEHDRLLIRAGGEQPL